MIITKPIIYLDIDGVILANESNASEYADEFVQFLVQNYPVKWLTTHVMDGDSSEAIERLRPMFTPETIEHMQKIRATSWSVLKTEAINFSESFLWFDDDLLDEEREKLEEHHSLQNWVEVDLQKNQYQLADFIKQMPEAVKPTPL